jgi:tripartite-type tricarboxylate transporter receptor subunit TctC
VTNRSNRALAAGVAIAVGLFTHAAAADAVADFYKDKTFTIVVGHEVGTGFDIYARALARHLGRHIPGHPNIVVQNMNGASGLVAANWLYSIAPKDGTVMATFVQSVPFEPLYGNERAKYDSAKFSWIGNLEESVAVCGVSKASGIKTFDDLMKKETIIAGTGKSGPLAKAALAVKHLLGAKIKLVSGYKGSASVKVAMNREEVGGICGLPMSTIRSFWRDDYQSGEFKPILQLSGKKDPALGGIPHVNDFIKTEEDRKVFELIFGIQALGRIFVAPPNVPADRVAALREAMSATEKDPQFLAEAAKTKIDIVPMTGKEVEEFIARVSASPAAIVKRAEQAYRND